MYILLVLAIFGMAFGADFLGPMRAIMSQERDDAKIEAVAYNMAVYHEASYRYVLNTPGVSPGLIPPTALELPTGYTNMGNWQAQLLASGEVMVTPTPTAAQPTGLPPGVEPRSVARRAAEIKGDAFGVGFVSNQSIRSARHAVGESIPLPAGVTLPEGSVVMITWTR